MLMYGNVQNVINSGVVFNLTSLKEGMRRLPCLVPPNSLGVFTGRDFDVAYMNYILGNDIVFREFFEIIYNLYIGTDVYLVISENDWSENLIESIIKLIQQRYGYNAVEIKCFEDFVFASNSNHSSEFAPGYGLYNLDTDRERYTYLVESERIRKGGPVVMVDPERGY